MTPEYDRLDEAGKNAKTKELQEKTLQDMKNKIGYAIQNINGDGIDELIIGSGRSYIYELFTMDDGKVREEEIAFLHRFYGIGRATGKF